MTCDFVLYDQAKAGVFLSA